MIKKLLFLFAILISVGTSSVAQCTPDANIVSPGFYPTSLPDAVAGQSYSQVLQFKVASDTSYMSLSGTITSATLTNVTGLPAGFSYSCNKSPNACTYNGGEIGCISLSGNPTSGAVGSYNLSLTLSFNVIVNSTPVVLPVNVPVTLKVIASNGLTVTKAPFFALTQRDEDLVLLNPANGKLSVSVFDMLGRVVKTGNYQSIKGEATYINVSGLEKGIYFVNLQLNGKQETIKISKGFY
ncbi:MAG: T9SS type A sorting domain-containing protein [Bacteroidetes bacterium]|nr:T9SS type A sorting domain-containing protein [Bacteroidota bacterium]